jgi:hypothetical protein
MASWQKQGGWSNKGIIVILFCRKLQMSSLEKLQRLMPCCQIRKNVICLIKESTQMTNQVEVSVVEVQFMLNIVRNWSNLNFLNVFRWRIFLIWRLGWWWRHFLLRFPGGIIWIIRRIPGGCSFLIQTIMMFFYQYFKCAHSTPTNNYYLLIMKNSTNCFIQVYIW